MPECKRCGGGGIEYAPSAGCQPCPDCMVPREGMWEKKRVLAFIGRSATRLRLDRNFAAATQWRTVLTLLEQEFAEGGDE